MNVLSATFSPVPWAPIPGPASEVLLECGEGYKNIVGLDTLDTGNPPDDEHEEAGQVP